MAKSKINPIEKQLKRNNITGKNITESLELFKFFNVNITAEGEKHAGYQGCLELALRLRDKTSTSTIPLLIEAYMVDREQQFHKIVEHMLVAYGYKQVIDIK